MARVQRGVVLERNAHSRPRDPRDGPAAPADGRPSAARPTCGLPRARADKGPQVRLAERPLAGAHRHRGVALEELGRAIALRATPVRAPRPRCLRRGRRSLPRRPAAARRPARGRKCERARDGDRRVRRGGRESARLGLGERAARQNDLSRSLHRLAATAWRSRPLRGSKPSASTRASHSIVRRPAAGLDDDRPHPAAPASRPSAATTDAVVQNLDASRHPRRELARGHDRDHGAAGIAASPARARCPDDPCLRRSPPTTTMRRPGDKAVHTGEPRRAARHPDTRQIAARKDRVALHGAGRDDDARRDARDAAGRARRSAPADPDRYRRQTRAPAPSPTAAREVARAGHRRGHAPDPEPALRRSRLRRRAPPARRAPPRPAPRPVRRHRRRRPADRDGDSGARDSRPAGRAATGPSPATLRMTRSASGQSQRGRIIVL